ncbi:hypothetical protein [uncultured Dubosiella sp.]|uniref:hypothetical protein n=1 Tax=uncultured Dubosiella sp. TaxID=1937011 RepID=UPI00259A5F6A|nr:hypothetical protein [uncultured Dubosiella sp.]
MRFWTSKWKRFAFGKKGKQFSWKSTGAASKSRNGYASQTMLVLFLFSLMLLSLLSVYSVQRAGLYAAMRQSTLDLSCLSHVKAMIENNAVVRQCGYGDDLLVLHKEVWIDGTRVELDDEQTYVACRYERLDGVPIEIRFFYSDQAIVSIEPQTPI